MSDERERFARSYRDLAGAELLALYARREELSGAAVEALRNEIKLRGIDPDSLTATVPKSRSDEEPPREGLPAAIPAEDADLSPSVPEGMAEGAERPDDDDFDAGEAKVVCPSCGQPNAPDETRCLSCHTTLRKASGRPGTSPRRPRGATGAPESGTVASATVGLVGVAGIVFAIHIASQLGRPWIALVAGGLGVVCVGIALFLYRRSGA